MTLVSPGVQVTVIDQSQYLPAPLSTIPLIVFATASNKSNPTGTGTAPGTTAATAGQLYLATSQRDLVNYYGNPYFVSNNGTPVNGDERNEYGLLTAYSALGVTNLVYCLRADIDLNSLVATTARPVGAPTNGTWWLDTSYSTWGIYAFNATTGQFTLQTPVVITDTALVSGGAPVQSVGQIGQYAVIAVPLSTTNGTPSPTQSSSGQFFFKNASNIWVRVGTTAWAQSVPTIQGTNSNTALNVGDTFTITFAGTTFTITIPGDNTVAGVVSAINGLGVPGLSAASIGGALNIFSGQTAANSAVPPSIVIANGSGTALNNTTGLGIAVGTYYQPRAFAGTSSQQPLWQTGQTYPAPTGSVWMKIGSSGAGLTPVISRYSSALATWVPAANNFATSDWAAIDALDSSGGQAIAAGTVYTQYNYDAAGYQASPVYYWERIASGPTIVTGTNTTFSFTGQSYQVGTLSLGTVYTIQSLGTTSQPQWNTIAGTSGQTFTIGSSFTCVNTGAGFGTGTVYGPYVSTVQVSLPGSGALSSAYTLTVPKNATSTQFLTAWAAAGIPYTTASLNTNGAIVLEHTAGGVIVVNDISATTGVSNNLMYQAGFVINTTQGAKYGPFVSSSFQPTQTSSTAAGTGLHINVTNNYKSYYVNPLSFVSAGTGYTVGDQVTFSGAELGGASPDNDLVVVVGSVDSGTGAATSVYYYSGTPVASYTTQLSNWQAFIMTAAAGAPDTLPLNGTNWFYSVGNQVDIMVNTTSGWYGYRNVSYNSSGFPQPSGVNTTDPNGPIVSATEPTTQYSGADLSYGDIWIDTSDPTLYPVINRWQSVDGMDQWVTISNTDSVNSQGVIFNDARWAPNSGVNPALDPIPTIQSMLTSNYIDLDAPEANLYPVGMLLFNTRRSGNNVKRFTTNLFTQANYPNATPYTITGPTQTPGGLPEVSYTWVTASGNQANGAPYMGQAAQRQMVVEALNSVIASNTDIRDEDNAFNLIATPAYPECIPEMIILNDDRGQTGFVVGDTPMQLAADATTIQNWATDKALVSQTNLQGLAPGAINTYVGLFYPSAQTTDLSGNLVVVPPSYMMIRTFIRNDTIAYPWFAAAGTNRGIVDNATSIGYINAQTGRFVPVKTSQGLRDILYTHNINPIVVFTGNGILCYGNKTTYETNTALDRINVARLVAYLRRQLAVAARPFIFEPNDSITRQSITGVIQTLLVDLVAKRGIYDYLVVCDSSNNTPARIDRNELWVDIAIEPVKAVEFIYIPVRVLATGSIGNNNSTVV
jgi:hypothetical protein